jgi:hypothetical protein
VHRLHGFYGTSRLFDIMAITAIFLLMAVGAFQAEKFYMFFMVEGHSGPGLIGGVIDLLLWDVYNWMWSAHDIRRVMCRFIFGLAAQRAVAHLALRVMAPLAMTAKTLPVVGPFEARLPQIGRFSLAIVTLPTWWYLSRRAVMVTGFASLAHIRHFGVDFMIEMHRAVLVDKLIQ